MDSNILRVVSEPVCSSVYKMKAAVAIVKKLLLLNIPPAGVLLVALSVWGMVAYNLESQGTLTRNKVGEGQKTSLFHLLWFHQCLPKSKY